MAPKTPKGKGKMTAAEKKKKLEQMQEMEDHLEAEEVAAEAAKGRQQKATSGKFKRSLEKELTRAAPSSQHTAPVKSWKPNQSAINRQRSFVCLGEAHLYL